MWVVVGGGGGGKGGHSVEAVEANSVLLWAD